ncbi:hypothetical protein KG088_17340 [Halomonas sp. TRM85114]|uniref:hypothetical protein n=1 Tax=Halomonas jincaotanensis TaxID=2810616 RepID=UPI001BD61604|nr:hypothetical protein [Halomonas jincaotanensis]MBS9405378.1 hypothetical protein [Halomonas jincaotanensis]
MSGLSIAVTHLNVPYGDIVSEKDFALALRNGTTQVDGISESSAAIIASTFVETTPNLLMRCIREAGASIKSANELYNETLRDNMPRCPEWEEAVQNLLDDPLEQLRGSVKSYQRPFDPAYD